MSTPQLIGLAFIAVPVLFALLLIVIFRSHRRQARAVGTVPDGWIASEGIVVDEESGFVDGPMAGREIDRVFVRTPIVRYHAHDGSDITFRSGISASFMPRPGQVVTVFYDPSDPNRARVGPDSIPRANKVASGVGWTLMLVLFVPFAALFGGIGYLMINA